MKKKGMKRKDKITLRTRAYRRALIFIDKIDNTRIKAGRHE